jgi:branched-chain amino acid transport system permease protein
MKYARPAAVAILLLALASLPTWGAPFHVQLAIKIMVMALFALSLDILVGHVGLVSLGHAAFFGLAGYVVALMSPQDAAANLLTTLPAALTACAAFALATGFLVLRTRGLYFVMVTLAFAQMLYFVFHDTALGGGSDGLYIYVRPELRLGDQVLLDLNHGRAFYGLVLALLVVVYAALRRVMASNFGRALAGIRENEARMRGLGYATFRYKLAAYVLSGVVAGLAGYLAALQFGFVNPEILGWHTSGNVLMMVILGGMGTLHGAMAGAAIFIGVQELLSNPALLGALAKHWQLAMGSLIIVVALYFPQGLAGWFEWKTRR